MNYSKQQAAMQKIWNWSKDRRFNYQSGGKYKENEYSFFSVISFTFYIIIFDLNNAAVSYTYGIIQTFFSLLLEKAIAVLFTGTFMFSGAYEVQAVVKPPHVHTVTVIKTG